MRFPFAFALALLVAAPAAAQHQHHAPLVATRDAAPAASASTRAYQAANARMHKDMDIRYSGDADVDFARGMIPHHRGAVEMARVQLAHGKDPELRRMAQEIIAAQEREIAFFEAWLKKNGR
jgi:uncharacterized protein (DUF305 family)